MYVLEYRYGICMYVCMYVCLRFTHFRVCSLLVVSVMMMMCVCVCVCVCVCQDACIYLVRSVHHVTSTRALSSLALPHCHGTKLGHNNNNIIATVVSTLQ